MKVYRASYSELWNYGGFLDYEYIVIANSEGEALGLALEAEGDSKGGNWEITEIDVTRPQAVRAYEHSS